MSQIPQKASTHPKSWSKAFFIAGFAAMAVHGGVLLAEKFWIGSGFVFFGVAAVFLGAGWPNVYTPISRSGAVVLLLCGVGMLVAFGTQIAIKVL